MSLLDSVEGLRESLDYHLARHNVLVSNLAQVDTPEYKPLDLQRNDDFHGHLSVAMEQTQQGHLAGSHPKNVQIVTDSSVSAGLDGNGVDLDREAVKIASNQMRYDMVAQLASSELADLAWAANDGRMG